jgi:hypothetical protein
MSIASVSSAVGSRAISSVESAAKNVSEEAQETIDVTKAEAAKGDQQAKQKLTRAETSKSHQHADRSTPKRSNAAKSSHQPATVVNISSEAKHLHAKDKAGARVSLVYV